MHGAKIRLLVATGTLAAILLLASWLTSEATRTSDAARAPRDAGVETAPKFCAALRGNGNYIATHFTSLARLAEHYGPFDGLAGGSSASITIFLYESMLMNPVLRTCAGGKACTESETGLRLSLMLKSLEQYFTMVITDTDEAIAVRGLLPVVARVKAEGIEALLASDPLTAAHRLYKILGSDDLQSLVNPEVIGMLTDVGNAAHNAREVYDSIMSVGKFDSSNPVILLRPGVLSFAALAGKLGRVGNLYAGYGPFERERFAAFLDGCAPGSAGAPWAELKDRPLGSMTCGSYFNALAKDYRDHLVADEANIPSRVDDPVGMVLHAAVATSVVDGPDGVAALQEALASYLDGAVPALKLAFSDVHYGYFGRQSDVQAIVANSRGYADLKSRKATALGPLPWRVALSTSPAEPGLARATGLPDGSYSAGGWPDLHPVLALRNMGCGRVVYITRRGDDSRFARGMVRLVGGNASDDEALSDLDNPASSYSLSLKEASAVWCTNWDAFKDAEVAAMAAEAYSAVLETADPFFAGGPTPYRNQSAAAGFRGCSFGFK